MPATETPSPPVTPRGGHIGTTSPTVSPGVAGPTTPARWVPVNAQPRTDEATIDLATSSESNTPTTAGAPRHRAAITLAAAIGISSALSFAVHALASRQLSVADYGGLAAVLALMTAAAVPVVAVQTALTRSTAEILASGRRPSGRSVLLQALPVAFLVVGIAAALAPPVATFLSLRSMTPIVMAGVWVAAVMFGCVCKGLLIGSSDHRPVAYALFSSAALRLSLGAVITPIFGVSGGIAAAAFGDLFAAGVYLVSAARRGMLSGNRSSASPVRIVWPDAGRALSTQLSLWLFASLSVVIGRRTLGGEGSGSFAAMATAAGACLFLPLGFATIVFPRFVSDGSRALLARATALAGAIGLVCALCITARPDIMFATFFGDDYVVRRGVLVVLCAQFVLLGCLAVLNQYVVARRHGGLLANWIGLVAAAFFASQFATTPMAVAVAILLPIAAVTAYVGWRGIGTGHGTSDAGPAWADRETPPASRSTSHPPSPETSAFVSTVPVSAPTDSLPRRRHGSLVIDLRTTPSMSAPSAQLRQPSSLDVSVIVPSYNGGDRLVPCVTAIAAVLDATGWRYEILVTVDGSTDHAHRGLVGCHDRVKVDVDPVNRGKGSAVRRGFAQARGEVVGFIDGDGDIAPSVLVALFDAMRSSDALIAVASKNQPGATVHVTGRRRVMSAGYRLIVHWMFDLSVSDTQCGCKAFRRSYLASTIDHAREDGFAFDLELLTIGHRLGLRRAVEVPVVLAREELGTVSSATAIRMMRDTIRIARRLPQATRAPLPALAAGSLSQPGTALGFDYPTPNPHLTHTSRSETTCAS